MIRINLLPYREAKRKAQARQAGLMALAGLGMVGVLFYGVYLGFDHRVNAQQARVAFLKQEITRLDGQIKVVSSVKQQREAMLAKLDVVETLQKNRALPVRAFNTLARRTPAGIYYSHVQEKPDGFFLEGYAESNGQVAELMRNLDASRVFASPVLEIISKTEQGGAQLGRFKMTVKYRLDAKDAALANVADKSGEKK